MGFQRGIKNGEHVPISGLKNGGETSNKTVKLQLVRPNPELAVLLHFQRLVRWMLEFFSVRFAVLVLIGRFWMSSTRISLR
jgi:hypothetical protein